MRLRSRRPERGAVTVLTVVLCLLLTTVAVACAGAIGIVVTHRRAEAAADLAALAAARAAGAGSDGCAAADRISADNDGELTGCRIDGFEATVEVTVATPRMLGHVFRLVGRARAGPVSAG